MTLRIIVMRTALLGTLRADGMGRGEEGAGGVRGAGEVAQLVLVLH